MKLNDFLNIKIDSFGTLKDKSPLVCYTELVAIGKHCIPCTEEKCAFKILLNNLEK